MAIRDNAKICILGKSGTGKTSLSNRLVKKNEYVHYEYQEPTIGASFFSIKYENKLGKIKRYDIWDTAGQERYRTLAPMYYRNASAALIVYDITNNESWEEVDFWVNEIKQNINKDIVILTIGNKYDLQNKIKIDIEDINNYVKENNIQNIFCSALSGVNCEKIIEILTENINFDNEYNKGNINISDKDIDCLDKPRYFYSRCC